MSNADRIRELAEAVQHLAEAVRVLAAGNPTACDAALYNHVEDAERLATIVLQSGP